MRSAALPASATAVAPPSGATASAVLTTNTPVLDQTVLLAPAPSLFARAADLQQAANVLSAAKDHAASLAQQQALSSAIGKLQPLWAPLPTAPYPPGDDTTGFPRSGDLSLVISSSTVSKQQLTEPARYAKGLADQALARRPTLTPLFWVGLACLGVGIYLAKK